VSRARRVGLALLVLVGLDLGLLLVSGTTSFLAPGAVGPSALAVRAGAGGLLLLLLYARRERPGKGPLVLVLLLLPTLVQFHLAGGRVNGDGLSYYVFVRSLVMDRDFDLANEYAHYGMLERGDLAWPTRTGLRRSIYSIGPAIVWTPFFVLGDGLARLAAAFGAEVDLSGYGPHHRNAVALGSLLMGFGGLLLIHSSLRRHFAAGTALGATLLLWGGSFVHWYMVWQPTYSHSASLLTAAYALWLWDRDRERRDLAGHAYLGLILGLAMCVRWQNGVLLLLPGIDLLLRLRREPAALPRLAGMGGVLAAGALVGASPQLMAWKALYGEWLLSAPPHGADFLRLDHPWLLETFFSSRHGLFSWTPVFWLGYLGFAPLVRRRPGLALPLLPLLLTMTWVNVCSGDWWAGASYSNRRFDSLVPLLAVGVAASVDVLLEALRRRPQLALALAAVPFALWNALLAEQARRALVPRDDVVAWPRLARLGAGVFNEGVGFPTTWPASWLFAARHDRPPGQYDRLVGKYLFYRQNNLGGHVDLGGPDAALLGEGWGRPERHAGLAGRRLRRRGRLFAPLDEPRDLRLVVRALSLGEPRELRVRINGRDAGRVSAASEGWSEDSLGARAAFWRRELNEVVLLCDGDDVVVASVVFVPGPA
jgi:hypothetical protein